VNTRAHRTNALFNLAGGASSACLVLFLPYVLNRLFSQEDYAIWALGFQATVYVPMLGLGIHQILNRALAHALALGDEANLHRQLGSGFIVVLALALIAASLVWLSAPYIGLLTGNSAPVDERIATIWRIAGSGASAGLLSLFFFGCFGGHLRYEWENGYKAIISLGFLLLVIGAQAQHLTLTPVMLSKAYVLVIACGLLFLCWRFGHDFHTRIQALSKWYAPTIKSYVHSMFGLGVWQLGMLMVSGFDLWIVARVNFAAVPGYAIALSFLVFLSGVISALISPCLPTFAMQLAQAQNEAFLKQFVRWQTRLILLVVVLCAILWCAPSMVWQFLLKDSASIFMQVFPVLLLATCVRLLTLLYSVAIVSANLQHRIILSPLAEGIVNLGCSIVLGYYLGVVGVALGTLVGALVCLALHALYNIPRTAQQIPLTSKALLIPWTV
jgi:O-antigen/teichoic acid export membrane protein